MVKRTKRFGVVPHPAEDVTASRRRLQPKAALKPLRLLQPHPALLPL